MIHAPNAHTDGDAIVHFRKANALHMGDTFFAGKLPVHRPRERRLALRHDRRQRAALAIADAKTRIIPGHGPLSGRDDLLALSATCW